MQQFLQFIILTFMYSSTCFGRPHAHHQELNNCSSSLWFYRWSVVIAVLLVVVGPAVIYLNRLSISSNFFKIISCLITSRVFLEKLLGY
jgi:hypothetical protein